MGDKEAGFRHSQVAVAGSSPHVVELGDPEAVPFLFLHGWYAYLREFPDLKQAVIMDVVIPGIDPWEQVLRNPYLWHFAFHSIPNLPERLVQGRQGEYFDYFYDAISADPAKITGEARAA